MMSRFPRHQAAVLSFSPIARDRRVLRQCDLLASMGIDPLVVAYANAGETIPFALEARPVPQPSTQRRIKTVLRQAPAHLGLWAAKAGFWVEPSHRWAFETLKHHKPRFVLANDWPALVVAAAYKQESGAFVHYDTHEFATLEFDERLFWRLVYKPMVTLLERSAIYHADSISTVGPKLAESLQSYYQLPSRPAVVRNIPDRIELHESPETAWPLRILYHGQVLPDRGIETLIDSVALWAQPHRLTIRGNGSAGYVAFLKAKAQATGRSDLISFEGAVAPDDVMKRAAQTADVGVHFTPLGTEQRHFSLPNKLFEYIGAGLAVAVSPGIDLRQVIENYGVGVVSRDPGIAAAAEAINSLTHEGVIAFKAASRMAAKTLCWENEREVLQELLLKFVEKF